MWRSGEVGQDPIQSPSSPSSVPPLPILMRIFRPKFHPPLGLPSPSLPSGKVIMREDFLPSSFFSVSFFPPFFYYVPWGEEGLEKGGVIRISKRLLLRSLTEDAKGDEKEGGIYLPLILNLGSSREGEKGSGSWGSWGVKASLILPVFKKRWRP